jgi:SAM pointed domain-containing ETS transcription factor
METPVITANPQAAPALCNIDWGLTGDELTFYEDNNQGGALKGFSAAFYPAKLEASTQCMQPNNFTTYVLKNEPEEVSVYSIKQECPSPSEETSPEQVPADYSDTMAQLKREIDYTCSVLCIPQDPYLWTVEHAQKWVMYTLDQYKLPITYLEDFNMDGTSLCMLSERDFVNRSPEVGQYLFAQLECWRNTHSLSAGPKYIDLDAYSSHPITTLASQPEPSLPAPMQATSIPTPVIACSLDMSPSSSHSSTDRSISPAHSMESVESCDLSATWSHNTTLFTSDHHMKQESKPVTPSKQNIHLWQFLRELLLHPQAYSNCIRWVDRSKGIFKIEDSQRVARLWGQRKNRPAMNYDKLSRSIRQYYKKGIIKKTDNSKRLVYQFCPQYRV